MPGRLMLWPDKDLGHHARRPTGLANPGRPRASGGFAAVSGGRQLLADNF